MKNQFWESVTKSSPCPICGKPDWCLRATSGEVAICYRRESPYLARSGSGWIHRLKDLDETATARKTLPSIRLGATTFSSSRNFAYAEGVCVPKLDFARVHASYDNDAVLLDGLALELGVEASALKALDVRFNHMDSCWSFPMRDAAGKIVGLRYRELGGSRKWSARGSHDGLFFAPALLASPSRYDRIFPAPSSSTSRCDGCHPVTLYITEGASDTATALSLGLSAIGRSSCTSGTPLIKSLLARLRPSSLAIIADNDAPGLAGARALSQELGNARIITPPEGCKDLREWNLKPLELSVETLNLSRVLNESV